MPARLRIGVIGGGLIAQVEHIPNLLSLRDRFVIAAVSDPSASVRAALAHRFGLRAVPDANDVLNEPLDALLIAAPDPWHAEIAETALQAGLHVFCEKPICYGLGEIDRLRLLRDTEGLVVQVGYMKRLDPAYRAAVDLIRGRGDRLRYIYVEVSDPDSWPFVTEHDVVPANDVSDRLRDATRQRQRNQVTAALGMTLDGPLMRGFTNVFCSALVHDVNAVHGLLDALGLAAPQPRSAAIFADGRGGHAAMTLGDGQAAWTMVYAETPDIADYRERVGVVFDDGCVELEFASPYLNEPTSLVVRGSKGHVLETRHMRQGYASSFRLELEAFSAAVTEGAPTVNTLEEARRDQALLIDLGRMAAGQYG